MVRKRSAVRARLEAYLKYVDLMQFPRNMELLFFLSKIVGCHTGGWQVFRAGITLKIRIKLQLAKS